MKKMCRETAGSPLLATLERREADSLVQRLKQSLKKSEDQERNANLKLNDAKQVIMDLESELGQL